MASPEIPSATLGPSSLVSMQEEDRRRFPQLPEPAATSRGFHRWSSPPPNGKTKMIGFLHLPDHIRTRIYELAIFDHDRGAVFLPRALPRKVQPDVDDLDIDYVDVEPERIDGPDLEVVECVSSRCVTLEAASSGCWVREENLHAASLASLGLSLDDVTPMTDKQILNVLDLAEFCADLDDDTASPPGTPDRIADSDHFTEISDSPCLDKTRRGWESRSCPCHYPSLPSDYDSDRVEETQDEDGSKSPSVQGSDISIGSRPSDSSGSECECGDAECRVCCELPIHHDDDKWDSSSSNTENVFTSGEHKSSEDVEHFDPQELIGTLYEASEPGILLACKEIRQECLPIYCSRNSFSWRFSWTDYLRSCLRFKHWAKVMSTHNLGLVTAITFQGRHMVEEGVEFSIDIDLLHEYPFFETRSYAQDDADIAAAIHREMAASLWLMVQSTRKRPMLSTGHLLELASIFVQGMHRDAGGYLMIDGASACRRVLSPLF